ncbi:MAG: SMC-Scp complex subunit ScpB [Eubacteriales bacterium]|uniref:SMC-Scp complex subunit ScpB n=1 Tax=Fenollaria sp. TaxID=1965292 RepID=UPI002A74BD22|nr:SMC-Scp complex subunit ScpB [Fenollaria sp.]MDD7339227.1 SMC-Scp complex subunit ScpB [Eubacteriales bacterium]MDY3106223.1 SMC-Scp complex subunit ScpB [Fenollaria sp.]
MNDIKEIIKALLFAWGDPLDIKTISDICEVDIEEIERAIEDLRSEMDSSNDGLKIIRMNSSYQLISRDIYFDYVKKLLSEKPKNNLSNASIETLSIIAYKQPVTKMQIEKIRSVKSDGPVNTLLDRGLIEEVGRLDTPGKPILYGTSDIFLRSFGIEDLSELPDINMDINIERQDNGESETE